MSVISLDEFRNLKFLRQFRRNGDVSGNITQVGDNRYNSDAIFYSNALKSVLHESNYNKITNHIKTYDSKYHIFGIKGKYRSLSIFFSLHQEYERILFTPVRKRTTFDKYILSEITSKISIIKSDIDEILHFIEEENALYLDKRAITISNKLQEILTRLSNA